MEGKTDFPEIIATLREHVEKICRRRQELQNDEGLLNSVIDRLNLQWSADSNLTTLWREKENVLNAYQKAREDRDEYKFQLNFYKNKTKELKEELEAARLNQTKHNRYVQADLSHTSGRKSYAYTSEQSTSSSNKNDNVEDMSRELAYLHKTNEKFLEEIRTLKSKLLSQDELLKTLNNYEGEIQKLKKIAEEKEAKMMDMQIKFDEKFINSERDFTFQISKLNSKILKLEKVRKVLRMDIETAHEEIRLLNLKKPVEETVQHSNSMEIPDMAATSSEPTEKETSQQRKEPWNVNTRQKKRNLLQAIENIMEQEHSTFTSLSEHTLTEKQQDEVKEMGHGVTKVTQRGLRSCKGAKKGTVAVQKQKAKKMKTSDEKNTDLLQNIRTELKDASSSNMRKGRRTRAVLNRQRKAADNSHGNEATNKEDKTLTPIQETNENLEPCSLESNRPEDGGI